MGAAEAFRCSLLGIDRVMSSCQGSTPTTKKWGNMAGKWVTCAAIFIVSRKIRIQIEILSLTVRKILFWPSYRRIWMKADHTLQEAKSSDEIHQLVLRTCNSWIVRKAWVTPHWSIFHLVVRRVVWTTLRAWKSGSTMRHILTSKTTKSQTSWLDPSPL